ncbi:hypothetical protein BDR26DRAFT_854630 [Obelidium mucronatum]|nr:hypothetical protein BDR26DRAFT_854630 [Obelidium mucronatum]
MHKTLSNTILFASIAAAANSPLLFNNGDSIPHIPEYQAFLQNQANFPPLTSAAAAGSSRGHPNLSYAWSLSVVAVYVVVFFVMSKFVQQ